MKRTKTKILGTALKLFNNLGLFKVTLRAIAIEMGISQGNLNYHFKKREEIIEALYYELVSSLDQEMEKISGSNPGLELLFGLSNSMISKFYEYRFLFLDFTQVMREHKNIKNHYKTLLDIRKQQISDLVQVLIKEKIIRDEELPNEYAGLFRRTQIFADFWISSVIIEEKKLTPKKIEEYRMLFTQSIYPYLTEKGKKEYHAIVNIL